MDNNQKLLVGAAVIGVAGIVIYNLNKGAGGGGAAAKVGMTINSLPGGDLVEGGYYVITLSVTNQSTKAGAPTAASLTITWSGTVAGVQVLGPMTIGPIAFAAGETKTYDIDLNIPMGRTGAGLFTAGVGAPGAPSAIATGFIQKNVVSAAISYAASVSMY